MENMRALRARIKSVESTGKITKSMKMVASSKLRKTQSAAYNLKVFASRSEEMLSGLLCARKLPANPFLISHGDGGRTVYVLFLGNRGLCGVYNTALLHYTEYLAEESGDAASVVVVGRWGHEAVLNSGLSVLRFFEDISDTPSSEEAAALTDYLRELYLNQTADKIVLVYQHTKSVLSQSPGCRQLLPVTPLPGSDALSDYIFEPDASGVLDALVDLYLENTVYAALLEAKAGEHSARMVAMSSAADNTDELISQLNLELNHARQTAITTEITEISGGAVFGAGH